MKKINSFIALCMVVFLSSCASYQKTAPIMGVGGNNINTYVSAELDYENATKIEGIVETKTLFGFINLIRNGNKTLKSTNRYKGLNKRESQALYKAKTNSNVDIILEPEFESENHSWFFGLYRTSTTKVKGWGINIKSIKEDKNVNGNISFGSSYIL